MGILWPIRPVGNRWWRSSIRKPENAPVKLAGEALWFEQHAPIREEFKKQEVKGITARVMQVAMLGGDCHPATPIGINLPNAEWIRERYGSKIGDFGQYHLCL